MAQSRRRRQGTSSRGYERSDRLSELLREIIAETLDRIDDDRLQFVTITGVDVDRELEHAKIYYTCLDGDDLSEDVVEGFAEQRGRIRKAIGAQAKVRRVPNLSFRPDDVLRGAQRIEEILASLPPVRDDEPSEVGEADGSDGDPDRALTIDSTDDSVVRDVD